jgi:SAM-dependent methyltransferase
MNYNQQSLKFWRENWYKHTVPINDLKFPEGPKNINNMLNAVGPSTVRDIGCGYGRLAPLFEPQNYKGFDIAAGAIAKAKMEKPGYEFFEWEFTELPFAYVTLLYIVMLHVDDTDLMPFCELVSRNTNRIVIGDIMKRYLNFNVPLCVGRDEDDYINIFSSLGFTKGYSVESLYPIYREPLTILVLDRDG